MSPLRVVDAIAAGSRNVLEVEAEGSVDVINERAF